MPAAIALLLIGPALVAQVPPREVEGVATIAGSDRPAARVKLHIFRQLDPAYAVVTDDAGRFRAPLEPGQAPPEGRRPERNCWAEAEGDGRWTVEAIQQPGFHQPPKSLRDSITAALARPVGASWDEGRLRVEYPEPGEVDVLVRGHDGGPLAGRPVRVIPDWGPGVMRHGPADARFSGQLDAAGRFQMRWFGPTPSLRVAVPGAGFGSTGPVEVPAGKATQVELTVLARFGSLSGKLDAKLAGPGIFVAIEPPRHAPVACDADGRFRLDDVPPGRYSIRATKGEDGPGIPAARLTAWLAPGQAIEGLTIEPAAPLLPAIVARQKLQEERTLVGLNGKPGVVTWAEGTVRDASGRPLVGAEVYLRAAHHGGLRMDEDLLATTTDAVGHYAFSGAVHPTTESPVLVAKVAGRPPAVADAEARTVENDRPARVDLTVADAGGAAVVAVTRGGRPLPGARVQLEATGGAAILAGFGWARGSGGPEKAKFEALVEPGAVTGPDGIARFGELIPGLYNVHAFVDPQSMTGAGRRLASRHGGLQGGAVEGVAIVAGRETAAVVPIAAADAAGPAGGLKVRFRVIRPDGRPVTGQDVGFQYGQAGSLNWSTSLKLDDEGVGEHAFATPGLWSVSARFGDAPIRSFPPPPPYDEAEALVAVSPALPVAGPVRLVGVRREPGSIRVRLLGLDGRPARGMVEIPSPFDREGSYRPTDANGEVVLEGLTPQRYGVRGHIEAPGPPPISLGGTLPDDDALRGPFVVVPGGSAVVTLGEETAVELRARRVGYIRGKVRPAAGEKPDDFYVYPWFDPGVLEPAWYYDPVDGEFFAGPFLGGPVTLQFVRSRPDGSRRNSGRQVVQVAEGRVARVDLVPGPPDPDEPRRNRSTMLGMGGIAVNEGVPAIGPPTAYLPDGRTPAFAAQAYLFEPGHAGPVAIGRSDGSGRLTWRGLWMSGNPGEGEKADEVARPTMIVSLPGRYGPTIVPVEQGKPARAVLAESPPVEGRVAVAGRPADGGSGILVVAAHQGRGVLDGALSRQVSPGGDGRFRLDGLAPGRYLVQAIRDGIWSSKAAELRLEADRPPPPIALEIPAPGAPITLALADGQGRPFAGRAVTLMRPEGPTGANWPRSLRTDAAGRITFPSLEAGTHSATVEGAAEAATFAIPEATAGGTPTPARAITLRRVGP